MVRIVRFLLVLIVVVVLMFPIESHSGVRFSDVGFEVGGTVEVVSPTKDNQLAAIGDYDDRTWVYGIGAAAVLPLGELFRASVGSGYFRSETREVFYTPPNVTVRVADPADYVFESVPLTGSVDLLLTESIPAVTIGVAFEMHFLTVTRRIHTQPALEYKNAERSASATIPGWSMTVGVEWALTQRIFLGVRGGYCFVEGEVPEVPFSESPEENYRFDIAGPFATMLIRVHPWQRARRD